MSIGGVVAFVEEAAGVFEPGCTAELGPLDEVGEIFAGGDLADVPFDPVAAGLGDGVGGVAAVVGDADAAERDRAVGGHGVGVKQDVRLAGETLLPEDDVLVLQAFVVGVEVAGAAARGCGVALEVGEVHEARVHFFAARRAVDVGTGEKVFGVDPGLYVGRVDVLHPAVGVRDFGAEIVVDLFDGVGFGVLEYGFLGGVIGCVGHRHLGGDEGGSKYWFH